MNRENYFILLDLDPEKHVNNLAAIETKIAAKQGEWSRDRNHPTRAKQCQQHLSEIPKIKVLMGDEAARRQEAAEAKKIVERQKVEALKKLDEQVRAIEANGALTNVDVKDLAAHFKMSETAVRTRLTELGVNIQVASAKATVARLKLERSVAVRIAELLKLVGKNDLYDFLDLPRSATNAKLLEQASEIYANVRQAMNKDGAIGAASQLTGDCKAIFKTDSDREKYDNTLALAKLDRIRELARSAGARKACIRARLMRHLVDEGMRDGLKEEDVVEAVREVASLAKPPWSVEVPLEPTRNSLQRCGSCGALAPLSLATCQCGTPFKLSCPRCSTVNPSENRYCATAGCGFPIGNMPLAERSLLDAKLAWSQDHSTEAMQHVKLALTCWPGHAEATRLKTDIERQQAAQQALIDGVEEAISQKHFMRAQVALVALHQRLPQYSRLSKCEKEIQDALGIAASCVARAHQLQRAGHADQAIDAFEEALGRCADYREAQQGVARLPPEPPVGLDAKTSARIVSLTWRPSPSRGQLAYRLIRKSNSQPTSPDDGDIIGETTALTLTDDTAEAGTNYYFAVYTQRGSVFSARASVIGPVQRLGEVEAFPVVARDRCVSLNWRPPSRAKAIEVWRDQGAPPRKRGEGKLLTTVTMTSASDHGLSNDTAYGYRVVTVYQDIHGRPVYSEGITLAAVPVELPEPVVDLAVVRTDYIIRGTWTAPPAGEVLMFLRDRRPALVCGDVIPLEDLSKIGQRLAALDRSSVQATVAPNQPAYLVPVTVSPSGATAVVGKAVPVSWMDDVDLYTGKLMDGTFLATWKWPNDIEMALVVWRKDRFPESPDDRMAKSEICLRVRYEQQGGFQTRVSNVTRLYVVVYSMKRQGKERQYSAGKEFIACPVRQLRHRVLPMGGDAGDYILELTSDASTELPELLLVIRSGRKPLFAKNGEAVLTIHAGSICTPEKPLRIPFRVAGDLANLKSRLFLAENANANCSWLELD